MQLVSTPLRLLETNCFPKLRGQQPMSVIGDLTDKHTYLQP